MNKYCKYIVVLSLLALNLPVCVAAVEKKAVAPIKLNIEVKDINSEIRLKDNFIKNQYYSAESRFMRGNVLAARDNFEDIIAKAEHDDYVLLSYAIKMAEFGLFEQTEGLFNTLDKNIYTENYVNDIKRFYYPSNMTDKKDLLMLADAYSAIMYNNLAIETTSELINNTNIAECDYKNYLISLGFYKSNNLTQALVYINNAIKENDLNINYKLLKAKILADMDKSKQAIKLMKEIKRTKFATVDFQTKIKATDEYLQYKIENDGISKDYHLAYYYYLQGKNKLAIKVLQSLILHAKDNLADIYALSGKIYYDEGDMSASSEFAQKAYNIDNNNYDALLISGNLNYDERKYEDALKFYKKAYKKTKNTEAGAGVAKCYIAQNNTEKAAKFYEKLLRKHSNNEDVLIGALNVYPQRADDYMAKIASVDIANNGIWLMLADLAIKDKNYSMAQSYLNNSYYIDENNFQYYYYLSLVLKAAGNTEKSKKALMQSINLNPNLYSELNAEGMSDDK